MDPEVLEAFAKPRVKALLEHFAQIDDPREPWRVAHRLDEVLLLVVCGTICACDDYEFIAAWGQRNIEFLRRYRPYDHGVPCGRLLTLLMNRINPELFSAAFTGWVREMWPERPDLVAIDGKTSRRSHDRSVGPPPLHLVSAFATTARLVLGQEAVADKSNETTAIPILLERLGEKGGLKDAVVSIDAIATNATIASAIKAQGADYLLAVKANQPTLRAEIEAYFAQAPASLLDIDANSDKGHGRIEHRTVTVAREVDWLSGDRRFPGELRLPGVACIIRAQSRTELKDRCRYDTRYFISSADLTAKRAGEIVRGHWAIENSLHWTLDVVFNEDQSRLRKGHGAKNMAVVRHFALNLTRHVAETAQPPNINGKTGKPRAPQRTSLKLRRRIADWDRDYLSAILTAKR